MTIWKKELGIAAEQKILMPEGSKIIHVHEQNGMGCIWFQFDPKNQGKGIFRSFITVGTGWAEKPGNDYVGTYHLPNGLVFHVFEKEIV